MMMNDENEPIAAINVTPFVDIVLVVLIIFMVTTPVLVKSYLEVQLPKAASVSQSPPSPLNITLSQDGQIDLNGQEVTKEELQSKVRVMIQENPNTQAIISADRDMPHGDVIAIIDTIKRVGINKFAIATTK